MKYDVLFRKITHLCAEMISCGGSSTAVPLQMNYICNQYGLKESEFIVNSNGIFATAVAPDGTNLTAVRSIESIGNNFGKLRQFDSFCDKISESCISVEELDREIVRINAANYLPLIAEYIASIFLGTGFAALFGAVTLPDLLTAVISCILITTFSMLLRKLAADTFFTHTVICLVTEFFILISAKYFGICQHPESITLGVIMLLISGLNFSDGLWFLLNKEIPLGTYKLNNAMIGALGIIAGIAMPLALMNDVKFSGISITAPIWLQVVENILACGGFAVLCCTEKKYVPVAALGAGLSWLVYALASKVIPSMFLCMTLATFAVTVYTLIFGRKKNLNPNILRAVGVLPLVPGTNLFYTLYGFVSQNYEMALAEVWKLIIACLGIGFGFTIGLLFLNLKELKLKANAAK